MRELARVAKVGAHVIVSADSRVAALFTLNELDFDTTEAALRTGQMKWRGEEDAIIYPVHAFTISELTGLFEAKWPAGGARAGQAGVLWPVGA